jgi:hypothetical protein
MYGIVNKAIEDLVREKFGDETWEEIKLRCGVDVEVFLSNQPYDDAVTFKLAQGVSEVTGLSLKQVLNAFGEWWVLRTSKEKYGGLMQAGGNSLKEFLMNLPVFHNRIMLIYPNLSPPEFKVKEVEQQSVDVHYFSQRSGLQEFVRGLLHGLAILYGVSAEIVMKQDRTSGSDHDVFNVSW